jgi:hypothetical protein
MERITRIVNRRVYHTKKNSTTESTPVVEPTLTFEEKLHSDYYHTKLTWVPSKKDPEASKAYHTDRIRLDNEFKADLLADLGITNHPKADLLYSKAYEMGHSSGRSEVYNYALDLVELIQ